MTPHEAKRALSAIELADALLAEFNNPSSALKGIGRETMEKLLVYLKLVESAQRRSARRAKSLPEVDATPATADAEELADEEA